MLTNVFINITEKKHRCSYSTLNTKLYSTYVLANEQHLQSILDK